APEADMRLSLPHSGALLNKIIAEASSLPSTTVARVTIPSDNDETKHHHLVRTMEDIALCETTRLHDVLDGVSDIIEHVDSWRGVGSHVSDGKDMAKDKIGSIALYLRQYVEKGMERYAGHPDL